MNGVAQDSFTYDGNSNRSTGMVSNVSFSATYDNQDRISSYGSRVYSFNNNGDSTGVQFASGVAASYVYDVFGSMKSGIPTNGVLLTYTNDGLHRRVSKSIGSIVQWRGLYQDSRLAAIVNAATGAIPQEYIYGLGRNVPDYLIVGGVEYRIITDQLGYPRLVVKASDGTMIQRLDYDTVGRIIRDTNSCFQPFGFAGGLGEPAFGFVRFGARDYDPAIGRWTNKDPIRFGGGDTNLYGYVSNDPINGFDPSGLYTIQIGGAFNVHFGGFNAQGGFGVAIDTHGGIGGYTYEGGGVSVGATSGFGVSVQTSNADNICDLRGNFANSSVHGGGGLGGAIDVFNGHAPNGSEINGAGIAFGAQEGGSLSSGFTNTQITRWKFH